MDSEWGPYVPDKHTELFNTETIDELNDLIDTDTTNTTEPKKLLEYTSFILGNHINQEFEEHKKEKLRRMLNAHLILLINSTDMSEIEYEVGDKDNRITQGIAVATEDLQNSKIVVRAQKPDGTITYQNIRSIVNTFSTPQMEQYNVGIGAAGTRTNTQKQKAYQYIKNTTKRDKGHKIAVDGSCCYTKGKKANHGGWGAVNFSDHPNLELATIHQEIQGTAPTGDPQKAEISGILRVLEAINRSTPTNEVFHIYCDCKNAVKSVNNPCGYKRTYADELQIIEEFKHKLKKSKNEINIKWLPGHTGWHPNEEADRLAKEAART